MIRDKKKSIKYMKSNKKGITLVALVVTIIVLLILAGVTITILMGDDGIIRKAQEAAESTNTAVENELQGMSDLGDKMNSILSGSIGGDNPPAGDLPKVSDSLGTVISNEENTDLEDSLGNRITVPAGFYIVTPSQDNTVTYDYTGDGVPTVQDGIVIQNEADGNQFVWVPIGTIKNKSGDELGATTTIKLGRYEDFTMNGTTLPTPEQEATASSYNEAVIIPDYYFEVSDSFAGNGTVNAASSYGNTKATNLQEWISTSLANGGYYIGRYEASQSTADSTKAASVKGANPWVSITQPNAATAAKKTYPVDGANGSNYYSDLINSYAWDTAIVFIQAYSEYTDYANENLSTTATTTGTNLDKVCNIHDMSGNKWEWTTESSPFTLSSNAYPCVIRGGYYFSTAGDVGYYTSYRYGDAVSNTYSDNSFRLSLYVK